MDESLVRSLQSVSAVPFSRGSAAASPLHSASVHVSRLSHSPNPVPVGLSRGGAKKEEGEEIFGETVLSPKRLRELTGEADLSSVSRLQISVNSLTGTPGNFGASLPRLSELRLVESVVPCVRDLGTGLARLVVLRLPHCKLSDLDGLPSLPSLQELFIAHNEVTDVSVAAMLAYLRVLDIESNRLSEEDQLGYLGLCSQLTSLSLTGNPLSLLLFSQQGGEVGYRTAVLKAVPQLKVLDNISVGVASCKSVCEADHSTRVLDYAGVPARPRTALSAGGMGCVSPVVDDSSELTHGTDQVMCGNPVRALKARRRRGLFSQSSVAMSPWYSPSHVGSRPEEQSVTMATSVVDIESQTDQLTLSPSPPPPPPSLACGAGTLWTTAARPLSADPRHRRYRRPSPSDSRPASQVDTLDLRSPTLPSQKLFNKFEQ